MGRKPEGRCIVTKTHYCTKCHKTTKHRLTAFQCLTCNECGRLKFWKIKPKRKEVAYVPAETRRAG